MTDNANATAKQAPVVGRSLADEVAAVIARALGELRVRRAVLAEQIGELDAQVAAIRADALRQLDARPSTANRKAARKAETLRLVSRRAQPTRAGKGPGPSAATRRRMSRSARRRWAAARKARKAGARA